jgi:hypothetical protein
MRWSAAAAQRPAAKQNCRDVQTAGKPVFVQRQELRVAIEGNRSSATLRIALDSTGGMVGHLDPTPRLRRRSGLPVFLAGRGVTLLPLRHVRKIGRRLASAVRFRPWPPLFHWT